MVVTVIKAILYNFLVTVRLPSVIPYREVLSFEFEGI
jgi:hypothetical protein